MNESIILPITVDQHYGHDVMLRINHNGQMKYEIFFPQRRGVVERRDALEGGDRRVQPLHRQELRGALKSLDGRLSEKEKK